MPVVPDRLWEENPQLRQRTTVTTAIITADAIVSQGRTMDARRALT